MAETDITLLSRYAASRDAEAFAELIGRYAGMVYGTCLRVLGSAADAEDVTQDCFLELARRAGKVRGAGDSVAGFVHALARSRATDFLKQASRRRKRERLAGQCGRAGSEWARVEPLVDSALAKLPEDQRELLVQHFLRGVTQADLAQAAGVDQSTISRRLARAVELLREELAKQGVEVSTGALGVAMAEHIVRDVPPGLQHSLAKMAVAGMGKAAGAAIGAKVALAAVVLVAAVGATMAQRGLATQATLVVAPVPATAPAATQATGVNAAPTVAELIRQIEQAELWVNDVKSFDLEMEGQQSEDANGQNDTRPPQRWRVAFDDRRVYFREDNVGRPGAYVIRVWDGKTCVERANVDGDPGYCSYYPQPHQMWTVLSHLTWMRLAPHPFWFLKGDGDQVRFQIPDYFGPLDDWQFLGTTDFHGTRCYTIERSGGYTSDRVYVGVTDAKLYGYGSYHLDDEEILVDELRNQAAADGKVLNDPKQIDQWFAKLPKDRLRQIVHGIAPKLADKMVAHGEQWMTDYREVAPGKWAPMTMGNATNIVPGMRYSKAWWGPAARSRTELHVTRFVIDEPLKDDLFAPDLKLADGVQIEDKTHDPPLSYLYKTNRTPEEWKQIEEQAKRQQPPR